MPMTDRTVNLGVKISADGTAFVGGVKVAQGALKDLSGATKTAGDAASDASSKHESFFAEIFKGVSAVELLKRGVDAVVQTFQEMVGVTQAAQQSHARLEAILRATGDSSGAAARQVEDLVQQLASTTAFDSTSLRDAAATMATFGRLTADTRSALLNLATDMAATGRGDLQTWVTMLSKVGTAPAEAIGLFERSFGKLDPAIKLAIQDAADFGDQAKAVQIFAQAASSTVGGTAVAAYSGLTRQIQGTKKAWDDLLEASGNKIFDAQSKEVSRLETDLRNLKGFLDEDHWFQKLMISLAGGNPFSAEASNTPQGQLGMYYQLLQQARAGGGPTADIESEIRRLTAQMNAIDETGGGKLNMANPFGVVGATGGGAPGGAAGIPRSTDGLSALDRQKLNQQQIKDDASYYDEIFKLAKNESDREIALIEYQHKMGLSDEETYTQQLGMQKITQAQLSENAITKQIEEARRLEAEQQAELSRATTSFLGGNAAAQPEVLAASQALAATKAKIKDLTAQQGDAEKNVDEAIKQSSRDADLARKAQQDRLIAIQHDSEDYARTLQLQTDDLQAQLDLLNADPLTQEKINNARKLTLDLDTKILAINREIDYLKTHGGSQDEIDAKKQEITDITNATNKAIADQANLIVGIYNGQVAKEIGQGLSDAVGTAIFQGGKAGAKQLENFLVQEFEKLVLKPILDPIMSNAVGSLLGGVSGGAGGGGAAAGAEGNLSGSLLSTGASSLWDSASMSLFGSESSTTIGTFGSGGFSAVMGDTIGEAAGAAFGSAVGDTVAYYAASVIPVIGWVIAIGGILYSMFGNKGGGPKAGGSFSGSFDPTGALTGNPPVAGTDNGRFYTPNQSDADLAKLVTANAQGYAAITRGLGGTAGSFTDALGYDTDPNGTANTRVSGRVTDASGNTVFNDVNRDVGKGTDQLSGELGLEAERELLAEFQNTNFDSHINAIFKGVGDAATASKADIDAAIQKAEDMAAVLKGIDTLSSHGWKGLTVESIQAMQQGSETLAQTFQRIGGEMSNFDAAFGSNSQHLADAQKALKYGFDQLGISVPASKEDFYNLVHGLDLSTDAGRKMFDALMAIAPAFAQVADAAQSAIDAFNAIGGQLSPSFAESNSMGALGSAIDKWHTFDTANAGESTTSSIADIKALIASGQLEAAKQAALAMGGTDALNALNAVLVAYKAWQDSLSSSTSTVTTSFNNVAAAVNGATGALAQAKDGIGQWLKGLSLDQNLSPLTPQARLDYAHDQYVEDLLKAKSGDVAAEAAFPQLANAYLTEAKNFFGPSSQYEAIFAAVAAQGGGLIGLSGGKPPTAADLAKGFGSVVSELKKLQTLTGVTNQNAEKLIAAIAAGSKATADTIKAAIRDGALTFS